jgi:hypothetical protein
MKHFIVEGQIILKWISKEYFARTLTGLIWLSLRSNYNLWFCGVRCDVAEITLRHRVVGYRRFGGTYFPPLEWSISPGRVLQRFTDLFPGIDFLLKTWFWIRKRTYGKTPRNSFYVHTHTHTIKRQQIK